MSRKNRRFSATFKAEVVERMKLGANFSDLARELKLSRTLLYLWLHQSMEGQQTAEQDPRDRRIRELEQKVASLEGVIGRQKLEADFLASALASRRGTDPVEKRGWRNLVYAEIGSWKASQGGLSIRSTEEK